MIMHRMESIYPGFGMSILTVSAMKVYVLLPSSVVRICLRMKYVDIPSVLEVDVEKAIRDRVEDGTGNLLCTGQITPHCSVPEIF